MKKQFSNIVTVVIIALLAALPTSLHARWCNDARIHDLDGCVIAALTITNSHTQSSDNSYTLYYDPTNGQSLDYKNYERDAAGNVSGRGGNEKYTFDRNGRLIRLFRKGHAYDTEITYERNTQGLVINEYKNSLGINGTYTYFNIKTDPRGNWISRDYRRIDKYDTTTGYQVRRIIYADGAEYSAIPEKKDGCLNFPPVSCLSTNKDNVTNVVSLNGKVPTVVVNVGFWCVPSKRLVNETVLSDYLVGEERAGRIQLLVVCSDNSRNNCTKLLSGTPYENYWVGETNYFAEPPFNIKKYPYILVFDPSGRCVGSVNGYDVKSRYVTLHRLRNLISNAR